MQKNSKKKVAIGAVIIAVVVIACLAVIGVSERWFSFLVKAKMTIDPYDTIEISKVYETIDDDTVGKSIQAMRSSTATEEEVTEGIVEAGDTVYISYIGTMDGKVFDGGTSAGTYLTIGSGRYIDGFEDGLIGADIGSSVLLDLKFPESYSNAELAGKDVTFDVTIISKTVSVTPDFTDEWCMLYSTKNFDETIDNTEDFTEYVKEKLRLAQLDEQIMSAMLKKQHVVSYDAGDEKEMSNSARTTLKSYADSYSMSEDTVATSLFGAESADDYVKGYTESYLSEMMLIEYVAKELGITCSDEELDAVLEDYVSQTSSADTTDAAEFRKTATELQLRVFEDFQVLKPKVLEVLRDRVVYVDIIEEETESTAEEGFGEADVVIDGEDISGNNIIVETELIEETSN